MTLFFRGVFFLILFVAGFTFAAATSVSAQNLRTGNIRGTVTDVQGGLVPNAAVVLTLPDASQRTVASGSNGEFSFNDLVPGNYAVRVTKEGFAGYENTSVTVAGGRAVNLGIALGVSIAETQVTVKDEAAVNTDPEAAAGAIVLGEKEIEALPDDPADLEAALRALAGPGSGPTGGDIFIDGFSGGRMPPADTIREVRINQNPFSSEFDRLGFGRIEILTKAGSDRLRGEAEFEFEDESLNSRDPFSPNKPPFRALEISGNVAGPLIKNRASYFIDGGYDNSESNALINAFVLDNSLNVVPFSLSVVTPSKEIEFSPRLDFALNERNNLTLRYFFERETGENEGVGGFDLPTRSFTSTSTDHTFRITETAVLSPTIVNETRFQYINRSSNSSESNSAPTIRVLDAFTSGGANIGDPFAKEKRLEFFNSTSLVRGRHSIKFGGRLRHYNIENSSPSNFAGTFTFTSIDRYRDTLLGNPGAFPAQFTISGGEPLASVRQTDLGLFIQDDWRYSPKLTLSFGLRYERQTNISSNSDFAPRFAVAYAPGAGGNNSPKTVFRGGVGIFYERFNEDFTLQARRFDGVNQLRFVVTDPALLKEVIFTPDGGVSNVPTVDSLASLPQTTRLVDPLLRSPYTVQAAVGIERQLPFNTTISASYIHASTYRLLRSRNINAPINGIRPDPTAGNIYQYESTARFRQNQIVVNGRSRFADGFSVFGNYAFGTAKSDSDGAGTFPANSFDLDGEYGSSSSDIRHRMAFGGTFELPYGFELSPFVNYRTGIPYNITTGIDANEDSLFTERPTFGDLGLQPPPDQQIIPRNYGRGPNFFVTNLRISREFEFGSKEGGSSGGESGRGGGGGGRGGINDPLAGGAGRGGNSGGDDDDDDPLFSIGLEVFIRNIFNTTNGAVPVGNLSSSFFGRSVSSTGGSGFGGGNSAAGNRRFEFEIEFSF